MKPYDTPIGEPMRTLVMTRKVLQREAPAAAEKFMTCFVEATKTFIDNPALAEKYVRETMFKRQITADDFDDAIGNSPFTYDITPEHIQITTDVMAKTGVGQMAKPPVAKPTGSRSTCWTTPRRPERSSQAGASGDDKSHTGAKSRHRAWWCPVVISRCGKRARMLGWVNPQVLPSPLGGGAQVGRLPAAVARRSIRQTVAGWRGSSPANCSIDAVGSMYRVVVGFAVGAGLALPLGLAMGASKHALRLVQSADADAAADPADRLHSAGDPVVRPGQSAGHLPDRARRVLPGADEHHRRRAPGRRHLPPRRAQPGREPPHHVPARDPAGRHAVHPDRACASASAPPSSW